MPAVVARGVASNITSDASPAPGPGRGTVGLGVVMTTV